MDIKRHEYRQEQENTRCTQDLCVQNSGECGENFDRTRGRFNIVQGKVNGSESLVDRKIGNDQKAR